MGRDLHLEVELPSDPVEPALFGVPGEANAPTLLPPPTSPSSLAVRTGFLPVSDPVIIGAAGWGKEEDGDDDIEELEIVSPIVSASSILSEKQAFLKLDAYKPTLRKDEEEPECEGSPRTGEDASPRAGEDEADVLILKPGSPKQGTVDYDQEKMSVNAASANLITCMIGASVLSLPRMVADSGWVFGPALLAFAGFISYRASMLVNDAVDATTDLCKGVRPRNVGEIVECSFGRRWKSIVIRLTCLFQVSKCGVYFVVIGTNLHFWTDTYTAKQCTLVATSLGIWLVFIRNINVLSKWSIIGVVAAWVYLFAIGSSGIYAAVHTPPPIMEDLPSGLWPKRLGDLPQIFAVMLYAYSPADVLPVMKNDMKEPDQMPRALARSHAAVVCIYIAMSVIAYLGWGRDVQGNVLQSMCASPGCRGTLPENVAPGRKWWTGYLLSAAVVSNLFVTVPLVLYCVFRTLELEYDRLKANAVVNRCMRLAVVLSAVSVALFVPHFIEILAVLATALLVTLQVLLPSALTFALSRRGAAKFDRSIAALFLLGVFVMVVGLRTAIRNLLIAVSQAS